MCAQANITHGFIVTNSGNGDSGIIGWNDGDINGATDARMLAVRDIEVWATGVNGIAWTENMVNYLGGTAPAPGPAAAAGLFLARLPESAQSCGGARKSS